MKEHAWVEDWEQERITREEWVVALADAMLGGGTEVRTVVGVCPASQAEPFSHVAVCPDQESAVREAEVIATVLGLPLYDVKDLHATAVVAEGYIDLDGDSTDQYAEAADRARRNGSPVPLVGVLGRGMVPGRGDQGLEPPGHQSLRLVARHQAKPEKDGPER